MVNPEIQKHLNQSLKSLNGMLDLMNSKPKSIALELVEDKESLDRAVVCAAVMNQFKTFNGQKLGIVNPNLGSILGIDNLRRGEAVLYSDEGETYTIHVPYSVDTIRMYQREGRHDFSHVIVNVPKYLIWDVV